MITCPNCNHQNPDGALQCEACYTPLPALASCPNCNATIQANASFCGQCGSDLREVSEQAGSTLAEPETGQSEAGQSEAGQSKTGPLETGTGSTIETQNFLVPEESAQPDIPEFETFTGEEPPAAFNTEASRPLGNAIAATEENEPPAPVPSAPTPPASPAPTTQLQTLSVRLRHVQTDTPIEIPRQLSVVRIGKPNEHTPPDIDVSGFPSSEIVSRVHANLRAEGDTYYLEDIGSSNGTYINGLPLPTGNRHRLRSGDRIALGKGDKISFIFESSS